MKRTVFCILFFLAVVWGWHTAGEIMVSVAMTEQTLQADYDEATPYVDSGLQVLKDANRYAEITVQTNTVPNIISRRYRPAGFSFDKLFEYLTDEQNSNAKHTFKSFLGYSQLYAARLKKMGYYIYTLRKIIV